MLKNKKCYACDEHLPLINFGFSIKKVCFKLCHACKIKMNEYNGSWKIDEVDVSITNCLCGSKYQSRNKLTHERTIKHLKYFGE